MWCISIVRAATGLALVSLAACNGIVGIGDVSLQPDARPSSNTGPDAGGAPNPACKIDPHFDRVVASTDNALLERGTDGDPDLVIDLNSDSRPDTFFLDLRGGSAGHNFGGFADYTLNNGDASLSTCGICVIVSADFDSTSGSSAQTYVPRAQGQLEVTALDATQLAGSMHGLLLRHVILDSESSTMTDAPDGCTVAIDEVDFNLTFSASARRADPRADPLGAARRVLRH